MRLFHTSRLFEWSAVGSAIVLGGNNTIFGIIMRFFYADCIGGLGLLQSVALAQILLFALRDVHGYLQIA